MGYKNTLLLPGTQFIETANGIQTIDQDIARKIDNKNILNIDAAFRLPHNVFFLNTESVITKINELCIISLGFNSVDEALGRTAKEFTPKKYASALIKNDQLVLNKQSMKILDEPVLRNDGLLMNFLSIKMPCYNQTGNIIGIFGFALTNSGSLQYLAYLAKRMGLVRLAKNLTQLSKSKANNIDGVELSPRQTECLYFLIRGKSAKQIGEILNLSARTIETYIENLRRKLNCHSTGELIEKVIEGNFQDIHKGLKKLKI